VRVVCEYALSYRVSVSVPCVCVCVCVCKGMRADCVRAFLCVDIIDGYCCVLIRVDGHKDLLIFFKKC
jgi:hypothetical protein